MPARYFSAVRVREGAAVLPPSAGLLEVEPPELVLSSLKLAEDGGGAVVRLYNISERPVEGRLRLLEPHGAVELVDLNEEPLGPAPVEDGWVRLSVRSNQIVTLKFRER